MRLRLGVRYCKSLSVRQLHRFTDDGHKQIYNNDLRPSDKNDKRTLELFAKCQFTPQKRDFAFKRRALGRHADNNQFLMLKNMKTLIFTIKETTEGSRSYVVKFGRKVKARFRAEGVFKNFVYKYSIAASSSGGLYSTAKDLDTVLRSLKASFENMIFAICQEEVCIKFKLCNGQLDELNDKGLAYSGRVPKGNVINC